MDSGVNEMVKLTYWRRNQELEADIRVGDLHAIVPYRVINRADTCFYEVSYQRAILHSIPVKGVYVAGGSSFLIGHILESINRKATPDLDSLAAVLDPIPKGTFITTSYKPPGDLNTPIVREEYMCSYPSRMPKRIEERAAKRGSMGRCRRHHRSVACTSHKG